MTERDALTLAILALHTCQDPDSANNEDWDKLETHADEAVTVLMRIRRDTVRAEL